MQLLLVHSVGIRSSKLEKNAIAVTMTMNAWINVAIRDKYRNWIR